MSPLIHAANVLYLVSYVLKDILWLRIVACVGSLCVLVAIALQPNPVLEAVAWNVLFFVINVVQIKILLVERRPVTLAKDEQRLHRLVFQSLRPRDLAKLLAIGRFVDKDESDVIVKSGKPLDAIMVIVDGKAAVKKDGRTIVELGEGRFVGEMSFLTGQPPAADVETTTATRLMAWPTPALKKYLADHPELRATMQLVIGTDLVAKLNSPPVRSPPPG